MLKYADGEVAEIEGIPDDLKHKYRTSFAIEPKWIIEAAARRQKWIDQAQSVNLWLASNDMKDLSHMYRYAWRVGLKTTYYLRTLGASNIEKATISAPTAAQPAPAPKVPTEAEKAQCSLEAQMRGEVCESCQ
jgi:ribonucleoside-diphosphate reductase alpha chain